MRVIPRNAPIYKLYIEIIRVLDDMTHTTVGGYSMNNIRHPDDLVLTIGANRVIVCLHRTVSNGNDSV